MRRLRYLLALLLLLAAPSWATIAIVGSATESDIATTASPVLTYPTGIADGDILFAWIGTTTTCTLSSLTGWNLVATYPVGSASQWTLLWRTAASEGSSWTFTNLFTATKIGAGVVIAYRGLSTTAPILDANWAASGSVTSLAGPTVTPKIDNSMIVQFAGCKPTTSAFSGTPDALATERYDSKANGNNAYVYIEEYQQTTAAALALTVTALTSRTYVYAQLALNATAASTTIAKNGTTFTEAFTTLANTFTSSNFTVAAGSNQCLVVEVAAQKGYGIGLTDPTVTGVKWGGSGGTALTKAKSVVVTPPDATGQEQSLWYLVAPTQQTSTIYVTIEGTTTVAIGLIATTWDNVAQTSTIEASPPSAVDNYNTMLLENCPSAPADLVIDAFSSRDDAGTYTFPGNQTQDGSTLTVTGTMSAATSHKLGATLVQTMLLLGGQHTLQVVAASFKPAAGGATPTPTATPKQLFIVTGGNAPTSRAGPRAVPTPAPNASVAWRK
jgi:hypothetical protein